MAPRKSRSRSTANVMAQYKQEAGRRTGVRKSPRRKKQKAANGSESSPSSRNSNEPRGTRRSQAGLVSKSGSSARDGKCMRERLLSDKEDNHEDDNNDMPTLRPEEMTEIPETPPRVERVVGRKRVFSSRPLDLINAHDDESFGDGDRESQRPSKKRKSFNTPPRDNQNIPRNGSQKAGTFEEASLITPDRNAHLSQAESGSICSGDEGIEKIDDSLLAPVIPLTRMPYPPANMVCQGLRDTHGTGAVESSGDWNPEPQQLDAIATSSVTITRIIETLNKGLVSEIKDMLMSHTAEVQVMQENMTATMSSDIQDMRSTIDMVVNRLRGNQGGRVGPKTSLSAWEQKLSAMTPHADIIFNTNVFSRILCINAPFKAVDVFEKVDGVDGNKSFSAIHTLLFSLQPGERKDLYSSGIGLCHSEHLYGTIQNAFFNVCSDKFKLFREEGHVTRQEKHTLEPGDTSKPLRTDSEVSKIKRPEWLKQNFVTLSHINAGRRFLETLNQSRKAKMRKTPSPDDVATHGVVKVYRLLRSHLHQSRDNVRVAFFEGLGYLFTTWSKFVKDTDQSSMSLSFSHEHDIKVLDLDKVRLTSCVKSTENDMAASQADAHNKSLLKTTFQSWPSMVLAVEHDVHVVSGGGAHRRHSGGEKRNIRKLINLIQVTCDVMVEYTRVGSIEMYLRGHPTSLQCVMIFAFCFRELCIEFIHSRHENKGMIPELVDVRRNGFSLKDLMPGDNNQGSLLKSRCLRMSEKCYDALHDCDRDENVTQDQEEVLPNDVELIKESAVMGIASI